MRNLQYIFSFARKTVQLNKPNTRIISGKTSTRNEPRKNSQRTGGVEERVGHSETRTFQSAVCSGEEFKMQSVRAGKNNNSRGKWPSKKAK